MRRGMDFSDSKDPFFDQTQNLNRQRFPTINRTAQTPLHDEWFRHGGSSMSQSQIRLYSSQQQQFGEQPHHLDRQTTRDSTWSPQRMNHQSQQSRGFNYRVVNNQEEIFPSIGNEPNTFNFPTRLEGQGRECFFDSGDLFFNQTQNLNRQRFPMINRTAQTPLYEEWFMPGGSCMRQSQIRRYSSQQQQFGEPRAVNSDRTPGSPRQSYTIPNMVADDGFQTLEKDWNLVEEMNVPYSPFRHQEEPMLKRQSSYDRPRQMDNSSFQQPHHLDRQTTRDSTWSPRRMSHQSQQSGGFNNRVVNNQEEIFSSEIRPKIFNFPIQIEGKGRECFMKDEPPSEDEINSQDDSPSDCLSVCSPDKEDNNPSRSEKESAKSSDSETDRRSDCSSDCLSDYSPNYLPDKEDSNPSRSEEESAKSSDSETDSQSDCLSDCSSDYSPNYSPDKEDSNPSRSEKDTAKSSDSETDSQSAPQVTPLQKIAKIAFSIAELGKDVQRFEGREMTKEYRRIEEYLMRALLSLDTIDTQGDVNIRSERKKAVQSAQTYLSQLEKKVFYCSPDKENSNPSGSKKESAKSSDSETDSQSVQQVTPLEKIAKIASSIAELGKDVQRFEGREKTKEYRRIEEYLVRALLSLDNIDTQGDVTIRTERKKAVQSAQTYLSQLEKKVRKASTFGTHFEDMEKKNEG